MQFAKASSFRADLLTQMRLSGDRFADELWKELCKSLNINQLNVLLAQPKNNAEVLSLDLPAPIQDFYRQNIQLPVWVNSKRIINGQYFFQKFQPHLLSMLGFLSLPYCYAGADGARVLYFSQRLQQDIKRRLLETAQFVWELMQKNAFEPEGKGLLSILRVRLVHAAVRSYLLQSRHWQMEWGYPINQEDMAGTNLAFSWICVRGLRKMGFSLNEIEVEDFLYLWNIIGLLSGVSEELLPENTKAAYWLDKRIAERQFKSSEQGISLTNSLLESLKNETKSKMPEGFTHSYMRFLLGDEIADMLKIPAGNWTKNLINLYQIQNFWQDNSINKNLSLAKIFIQEKVSISLPQSIG